MVAVYGARFLPTVGRVFLKIAASRLAVGVGAGLGLSEAVELMRQEAPGSADDTIEEAARMLLRMSDESEVLWPTNRKTGDKVPANYFVMNLKNGNAWITSRYHSKKSVDAGFRRGVRSGSRGTSERISREAKLN